MPVPAASSRIEAPVRRAPAPLVEIGLEQQPFGEPGRSHRGRAGVSAVGLPPVVVIWSPRPVIRGLAHPRGPPWSAREPGHTESLHRAVDPSQENSSSSLRRVRPQAQIVAAPVMLDWLGCATFRFQVDRLVVFLDAYLDRVPGATGPAADRRRRAGRLDPGRPLPLRPPLGRRAIAPSTGRRSSGATRPCGSWKHGVPLDQLIPVAGGERVRLSPDPCRRPCSRGSTPACGPTEEGGGDEVCLGDLGPYQEQQERFAALAEFRRPRPSVRSTCRPSVQGARGDGGALVYLSRRPRARSSTRTPPATGRASCATSGPTSPSSPPPVGATSTASRCKVHSPGSWPARPACCDRAGSFLSHHDDWFPGFSTPIDLEPVRAAMALVAPGVELVETGYLEGFPLFRGLA